MIVFIDKDYKCHMTNDDNLRAVETAFFDGKCPAYIEGFRFIPSGEIWVRDDGIEFCGEIKTAWKPYSELDAAQRKYERQLLAEYEAALAEIEKALGVSV
jgi:hypothetical protein